MNGAAIPAAAACIILGGRAAGKLKERESLLAAWDASLQRMEGALTFGGAALPKVLEAGKAPALPELDELLRRMADTPAAPVEKLLDDLPWNPLLTDAEKNTLLCCFSTLFSPSLSQQSQALAHARESWQEYVSSCKQVRQKNARLYLSLGWLGGAALFILFC